MSLAETRKLFCFFYVQKKQNLLLLDFLLLDFLLLDLLLLDFLLLPK